MASLMVIGGTGFFGKSILDAYKRGLLNPWEIEIIYILSRHSSKLRIQNPELITKGVFLVDTDISICSEIPFADYVIHAAGSSDANKYLVAEFNEDENIINSVENFCKIAPRYLLKSRILYASSGAVYGKQGVKIDSFSEESILPASYDDLVINKIKYAKAKIICEKKFQELADKGLNVVIARCFTFIGPYLPRDQHFAAGNFLADAIAGNSIGLKAKFIVERSYMYADDLVMWMMQLMKLNINIKIINIGSDVKVSIEELAEIVAQIYNVEVNKNSRETNYVDRYIPNIDIAKKIGLKYNSNLYNIVNQTKNRIYEIHNEISF